MDTQLKNISEMGFRSYQAGLKPEDCPFTRYSTARLRWLKGYSEAKTQAEDAGPEGD